MMYTIMTDFGQTGVPAYLSRPRVAIPAIEAVDFSFRKAQIELSKVIKLTERPDRHLTLEDQAVFDRAFRRSARVRQVIQL